MSEQGYYTVNTKVDGKKTFAKVSDAKRYMILNWDRLADGREHYCILVNRNLLHYGTYTKIGKKLVRCD